jgi:hypothetical protein
LCSVTATPEDYKKILSDGTKKRQLVRLTKNSCRDWQPLKETTVLIFFSDLFETDPLMLI